ncbi:MAG: FtsX-like permease family protein [Acidobacteria bacterium]|nr:FtsX-like permease family protein [Acidobacteriota bacterium]
MIRMIWARVSSYASRRRAEHELREEIQNHLAMATEHHMRRGLSRREAELAARRDFGSVDATRERYNDQLGLPSLDAVLADFRIARRQLAKTPGFTATVCVLLALGIGASTTVYSIVDAVLLAPLPGAEPEARVWIDETVDGRQMGGDPARLRDMQGRLEALSAIAGFYGEDAILVDEDTPRRVPVLRTFGDYFSVVGLFPSRGRVFTPDEIRGTGDPVVIISEGFAARRFDAADDPIGQSVRLAGQDLTVVGIMPRELFPRDVELFIPADPGFQEMQRGGRFLAIAGRLASGRTIDQAQEEMDALMGALQQEYPDTDAGVGANLRPLHDAVVGEARTPVLALFGTTVAVLLLTTLNLAGLMLARGLARRSEIAVRVALGASAGRVVRLFLIESALVALTGATAGIAVAGLAVDALGRFVETTTNLAGPIAIQWHVALVGVALAALAGLVLGGVPAWQATRRDAAPALREGRVAGGMGNPRLRRFLVGGQVALSVVPLIAAALLTREMTTHLSKPLGFEPAGVLTVKTQFSWSSPGGEVKQFIDDALERIAAVPGVRAVGMADRLPLEGASQSTTILIRGREMTSQLGETRVARRSVSADYLQAIGVPLISGEGLDPAGVSDAADYGGGVVVNQAFAATFFGATSPIGAEMSFFGGAGGRDRAPHWRRIVGVVGDVRREVTEDRAPPEAFSLYAESGWPLLSFAVAAEGADPGSLASAVREAIAEIAPSQVIDSIEPMTARIGGAGFSHRRNAGVMYGFAALALVLVMVGLYGLIATEVAARIPEMGVRAALGAGTRHIVSECARHTLVTTAIGAVIGAVTGIALASALGGFLTAVEPADPLAIVAALAGMALAAGAAALPGMVRAARVDPARALRHD